MPTATTISGPAKEESLAGRRRSKIIKIVGACLSVTLLMYAGLRGAQQARLQGRLDDLASVRNQLQQKVDEDRRPTERLVLGTRGTNGNASPLPSPNPQVAALANALKIRLGQFDSVYNPEELSGVESLEFRLSQATLANAERRFAEALARITEPDEKESGVRAGVAMERFVRVLRIRGDAFYGLDQWPDALKRYRRVLTLRPYHLATIAKIADCDAALGQTNEAFAAYGELAVRHHKRATALLVERRIEAAVTDFKTAVDIYVRLVELGGEKYLAPQFAGSLGPLAWIHATHPDSSVRDGKKARRYALMACELTGWQSHGLIETLAVACAETGNFAEAIKWQEKALELAPADSRIESRSRLELYKAGKPYRVSP